MNDTQYSENFLVTSGDCISAIDASLPDLLGTYVIVKWMEIVSAKNINQQLDDRHISVGKKIAIEHQKMVQNGENVEVVSTLQRRENRHVSFVVVARNHGEIIAEAQHERMIIPTKLLNRMVKQ